MIHNIQNQIGYINESLEWIRNNRPNDYEQKFIQLVECRRILRRLYTAAGNNPGIAAFGKSQVGKSYLISCLLQGKDQSGKGLPFMVKSAKKEYDFVLKINPPSEEGGGRESTGVVSRFSSFKRNKSLYNENLPVLVNLFSVADIIIILADSYFSDFSDYTLFGEYEIEQLCNDLDIKYRNKSIITSPILLADDILNIKSYFIKHLNVAQVLNKSAFFDRLALLIDRIPTSDYLGVFSNLWHEDETFSTLFRKLLEILQKFDFSKSVYLPIESVVHEGVRENTIMSVQCLKQLFESKSEFCTDVFVSESGKFIKKAVGIPKSEICAVCSEVVFKIDETFLTSERPYEYSYMDETVKNRISHNPIKMEILEDNDLLDFPGARAREQEQLSKLSLKNILDFFLRGKVAYLFNKYNEEMGINILLYCHHNKDNDVTNLYKLLEDWVNNYVGENVEERRKKIEITKKSPLFYIGTMFNLDMVMGKGAEMTAKSIDQRWKGRFDTVVNNQCFHRTTAEWVTNWTFPNENFSNSYVLRDYKFSQSLYRGFDECGKETGMSISEEYYALMRQTFIENEYVKRLFEDPAMAWDVTASQNNDGALYIIENLAIVAASMDEARERDFDTALKKIKNKVLNAIQDYFVSTDTEEILESNMRKAKAIFREMDFTCNEDNYYFGHLLQALQMSETDSYRVIHQIIQSPDLNESVNAFKDYEIIRSSCAKVGRSLDSARTESEKMKCIIDTYGFINDEEAYDFLLRKGIDKSQLFSGSYKRKLNSCIIADSVFEKWCSMIKSVEFLNEFSNEGSFDAAVMGNLIEELILTADFLSLRDKMAVSIAEYVNVIDVHAANEGLLADILATMINDFVLDFGYSWLSEEEIEKAKSVCEKRNIPAFKYILKELPATFEEVDITAMFNEMSTNPKALLPSFEDNYNKWLEYMFISFIAHLDIPDFDHEANQALQNILERIKAA